MSPGGVSEQQKHVLPTQTDVASNSAPFIGQHLSLWPSASSSVKCRHVGPSGGAASGVKCDNRHAVGSQYVLVLCCLLQVGSPWRVASQAAMGPLPQRLRPGHGCLRRRGAGPMWPEQSCCLGAGKVHCVRWQSRPEGQGWCHLVLNFSWRPGPAFLEINLLAEPAQRTQNSRSGWRGPKGSSSLHHRSLLSHLCRDISSSLSLPLQQDVPWDSESGLLLLRPPRVIGSHCLSSLHLSAGNCPQSTDLGHAPVQRPGGPDCCGVPADTKDSSSSLPHPRQRTLP